MIETQRFSGLQHTDSTRDPGLPCGTTSAVGHHDEVHPRQEVLILTMYFVSETVSPMDMLRLKKPGEQYLGS